MSEMVVFYRPKIFNRDCAPPRELFCVSVRSVWEIWETTIENSMVAIILDCSLFISSRSIPLFNRNRNHLSLNLKLKMTESWRFQALIENDLRKCISTQTEPISSESENCRQVANTLFDTFRSNVTANVHINDGLAEIKQKSEKFQTIVVSIDTTQITMSKKIDLLLETSNHSLETEENLLMQSTQTNVKLEDIHKAVDDVGLNTRNILEVLERILAVQTELLESSGKVSKN